MNIPSANNDFEGNVYMSSRGQAQVVRNGAPSTSEVLRDLGPTKAYFFGG